MRRRLDKDDRGIALISVMICVMLSFLLSATILRISLLSYIQKGVAKQAAATFYENESFMDDMKMGLQQKAAVAFSNAFTTSQSVFLNNFENALFSGVSGSSKQEKLQKALAAMIVNGEENKKVVVTVGNGTVADSDLFISEGNGEIVIKDVCIKYTDETNDGYYSEIKTDIRIRSPFYTVTTTPAGGGYTMLAGGGTQATSGDSQDSMLRQYGNYYSGYQSGTYSEATGRGVAKALSVEGDALLWFDGDDVTINGDVYISDNAKLIFLGKKVTIRGTVYVGKKAKLIIGNTTNFWCRDIVMTVKVNNEEVTKKASTDTYAGGASYPHIPYPKKGAYEGKPQSDVEDFDFNGNETDASTSYWQNGVQVQDKADAWHSVYISDKSNVGADLKANLTEVSFTGNGGISPANNITITDKAGTTTADKTKTNPVKNTTIGSESYDQEFLKVVDIYWFLNASSLSNHCDRPEKLAKASQVEDGDSSGETGNLKTNQPKFYFKTGVSLDQNSFDQVPGQNGFGTLGATVTVGTPPSVYNVGKHFILANSTVTFNDQNMTQDCYVVCISPKVVIMKPKDGGIMSIKPLEQATGVSSNQYKSFIDSVGLLLVQKANASYTSYGIVNNFFKGGIKSLYAQSGDGPAEEQIVTVTATDKAKNKSVEIVSFENWEKK